MSNKQENKSDEQTMFLYPCLKLALESGGKVSRSFDSPLFTEVPWPHPIPLSTDRLFYSCWKNGTFEGCSNQTSLKDEKVYG